jgi:hypothetical protein
MLALKQALSLVSTKVGGGAAWSPSDESSLEAWYKYKVGITLNGSDVKSWQDSAATGLYDMVQDTETEQPAYSAGALTFVSANLENLQTTGQISLTGDFTLGLRINTSTTNGAFLADNTSSNEYFKYSSSSRISFKIAGSTSNNLDLDSGTFGDDYIVITRLSDVLTLWKNGVAQSETSTVPGTSLIDVIGLRRPDGNAFDGTISEIQIYSSSDSILTSRINARLSTL